MIPEAKPGASLCDNCFAPGQCCKRLQFFRSGVARPRHGTSNERTFWLDEPIEQQLRASMHAEDADRPIPFRASETTEYRDAESGRPYGSIVFTCVNLQPDGRCGDYENRPWLCRVFEPASDHLCVHFRGAEGGAL